MGTTTRPQTLAITLKFAWWGVYFAYLVCLVCGECPKPCHARIFWQRGKSTPFGADFHKLIGLIWIVRLTFWGYFVPWNYTVVMIELSTFNLSRFLFSVNRKPLVSTAHTKKPCFKSAIYHLMYKYKKNPPKSPHFWPKKPFFCLNFVLQKYCILHWFFMLIFRHTVTQDFWQFGGVTQPSCNFLTPKPYRH